LGFDAIITLVIGSPHTATTAAETVLRVPQTIALRMSLGPPLREPVDIVHRPLPLLALQHI